MSRITSFVLLATAVIVTGCSSFNREWKRAATQPASAAGLDGRWDGRWLSEADGHYGRLRCIITKSNNDDYRARFHANFLKILSYGYTVSLKAERTNDAFQFRGQANLGWLAGGLYTYEGHADATNFSSTYSCKRDHGTFQMRRVE